jgi:hypothetical protein
VYDDHVRPGALEPLDRCFAAVRRAVVDDQEHTLGLAGGLDGHELLDQLAERLDPVCGRAAVEDLRATHVPGGQVAESALALVLVFDQQPIAPGLGGDGWMDPRPGLNRRLLVRAHHEIAGLKQLSCPAALRRGRGSGQPSDATAGRAGRSRSGSSTDGSRPLTAIATPSHPRSARRSRARPPRRRAQRLTSVRAGRPARPAARTPAPSPRRSAPGEKDPGRPERGRSSRPSRPSSKKRFRHPDTACRDTPSRSAIAALDIP